MHETCDQGSEFKSQAGLVIEPRKSGRGAFDVQQIQGSQQIDVWELMYGRRMEAGEWQCPAFFFQLKILKDSGCGFEFESQAGLEF